MSPNHHTSKVSSDKEDGWMSPVVNGCLLKSKRDGWWSLAVVFLPQRAVLSLSPELHRQLSLDLKEILQAILLNGKGVSRLSLVFQFHFIYLRRKQQIRNIEYYKGSWIKDLINRKKGNV